MSDVLLLVLCKAICALSSYDLSARSFLLMCMVNLTSTSLPGEIVEGQTDIDLGANITTTTTTTATNKASKKSLPGSDWLSDLPVLPPDAIVEALKPHTGGGVVSFNGTGKRSFSDLQQPSDGQSQSENEEGGGDGAVNSASGDGGGVGSSTLDDELEGSTYLY